MKDISKDIIISSPCNVVSNGYIPVFLRSIIIKISICINVRHSSWPTGCCFQQKMKIHFRSDVFLSSVGLGRPVSQHCSMLTSISGNPHPDYLGLRQIFCFIPTIYKVLLDFIFLRNCHLLKLKDKECPHPGGWSVQQNLLHHVLLHIRGEKAPLGPLLPPPGDLTADLPHLPPLAPLLPHYDWPQFRPPVLARLTDLVLKSHLFWQVSGQTVSIVVPQPAVSWETQRLCKVLLSAGR